jgi:hypothetical protein
LDFRRDESRLEDSDNPAAVVVSAHLSAQATRGDMELRKKYKWQLTRRLYERGYSSGKIVEMFRLIDWLMRLPEGLELAFCEELMRLEEEKKMPYITSIERIGRQEGRQETMREDILEILEARFGSVPEAMCLKVRKIDEEPRLKALHRRSALVESLSQFEQEL